VKFIAERGKALVSEPGLDLEPGVEAEAV